MLHCVRREWNRPPWYYKGAEDEDEDVSPDNHSQLSLKRDDCLLRGWSAVGAEFSLNISAGCWSGFAPHPTPHHPGSSGASVTSILQLEGRTARLKTRRPSSHLYRRKQRGDPPHIDAPISAPEKTWRSNGDLSRCKLHPSTNPGNPHG